MSGAALKKTWSKEEESQRNIRLTISGGFAIVCFLKAHFSPGVFAAVGFVFDFDFLFLYGNFGKNRVSTENIFSILGKWSVPKRRLAGFLHDLGYSAKENVRLSSRVCAKCASKIRRAAELKSFLDCSWWRRNVPCKLESIRHRRDSSEEPPWWEFHSYSSIAVISISFVCT